MRTVLLALLAVSLAAAPAGAAARLYKSFDFEERQLGNDEDLPMHWAKLSAVDLPHYVTGRLTTDRARSGRYSFRMDLDGGSCVYQYDPARTPATVGGHYRLTGWCRSTVLAHARCRLTLAAADAAGNLLDEAHSDLYAAATDADAAADDWHPLTAELTVADPAAATLRVRMELLQPARYAPPSDPRAIPAEDVHGSAWFDDLTVAQVPRATLSTDRPGNVFRRGDAPAVSVLLTDPSSDDLTARLAVTDSAGRPVFQRTGTLSPSTAEPAGDGRYKLSLPLPVTAAGWYRATVSIAAGIGSPGDGRAAWVGSHVLDYVQLADGGAVAPPDDRFGVDSAAVTDWPAVTPVLPLLAVGRAKVAMGGPDVVATLDRLADAGIAPVGCLPTMGDATDLLVSRYAGRVDLWQVGSGGFDATSADDRRSAATAAAAAARLTGHFDPAVPCWLGFDPPPGRTVAVSVSPSILPGEIGPYLRDLTDRPVRVASVSVLPIDAAPDEAAARAADLAERIVSALAAGAPRVDVPVPVVAGQPTDLLPVERSLLSALSGAACYGRVPVADGVEAFLFQRPDGPGLAVVWADATAPGGEQAVGVRLGERLARTDLWGNTTPLPAAAVRAGPVPVILTGVDVPLARLRAGVTLDPPAVESVLLHPQVRRLHLFNPYTQPASATVRLHGPAGWTLSPSVFTVAVPAGGAVDRDVGIDLPVNARAGPNTVTVDVDLEADRAVRLSVPLVITVGLAELGVRSTAFRDAGGAVVVQQRITNYGTRPVDYVAYVNYPGRAREERLVTGLAPGGSTLKRYRFDKPGPDAVRLRVGVKEADGPRVLNEELAVPGTDVPTGVAASAATGGG